MVRRSHQNDMLPFRRLKNAILQNRGCGITRGCRPTQGSSVLGRSKRRRFHSFRQSTAPSALGG